MSKSTNLEVLGLVALGAKESVTVNGGITNASAPRFDIPPVVCPAGPLPGRHGGSLVLERRRFGGRP